MATQDDVRRVALSLAKDDAHFAFSVRNGTKRKRFAWIRSELIGGWRCEAQPALDDEFDARHPKGRVRD